MLTPRILLSLSVDDVVMHGRIRGGLIPVILENGTVQGAGGGDAG